MRWTNNKHHSEKSIPASSEAYRINKRLLLTLWCNHVVNSYGLDSNEAEIDMLLSFVMRIEESFFLQL